MPRILIADDELTSRMEIEEMLTFLGYEVVGEAETGRQAVDMALELKPDIILMDIVMPGEIDGISAAEEIKTQSDAVIVFISGYGDAEHIERAKRVEPFGYVMKPFDEKEIRGFVEIALYKKEMENRMKASHAQLSALFENTDDFIMIADEKGIPQSFNAAYKRIIKETLDLDMKPGIQPHKFLNDPKAVQYWDELHRRVLSGEKFKAEFKQKLISGETRHFEFSFSPIIQSGEMKGFVEVTRDVTEVQRILEEMTESREKYRQLVNHAPAGVFEVDFSKQRFVQVNDLVCEYMGYTREEFLSMSPFDILDEESKSVFGERLKKVVAGESVPVEAEFKIRAKSGRAFWVLLTSNFIYEENKIKGAHVVVHDITERKQAEEALRKSEAKLRTILDSLPDMVLEVDSQMKIHWANKMALDMNVRAIGQPCYKAFPGNETLCEGCVCQRSFETGKIESGIMYQPESATAGESYWENIGVPLKDREGHTVRVLEVSRNVTERELSREKEKRLQGLLIHSQKMEAIATLTGGIAHDYNNLLSIIVGNLGLAQQDAESGSTLSGFLNEAEKAARKVGNLTHELMALSRGGGPIKKLGSIRELLKASADVVSADSGITVNVSMQEDLWPVPHDSRKMATVFRNVVQNALEAMPEGGSLALDAENLRVQDGDEAPGLSLRPGEYVRISVQDSGIGISKENLDKIFDPYFSTKPMGVQKGMGLGLATAHAVVQKHGGEIIVHSTLDGGTTVHIYLLAEPSEIEDHITKRDEIESKPVMVNQESENIDQESTIAKILVMDDEEMLRKLAKEMLKRLSYRVEAVTDGSAAIDIYKNHLALGDPFDAVILDLTIKGGMGGEDALKELLKIDPDVKAIVSSGYFNDPVMADFRDYGFKGAMAKPYEMKDLKEAIEMALSAEN